MRCIWNDRNIIIVHLDTRRFLVHNLGHTPRVQGLLWFLLLRLTTDIVNLRDITQQPRKREANFVIIWEQRDPWRLRHRCDNRHMTKTWRRVFGWSVWTNRKTGLETWGLTWYLLSREWVSSSDGIHFSFTKESCQPMLVQVTWSWRKPHSVSVKIQPRETYAEGVSCCSLGKQPLYSTKAPRTIYHPHRSSLFDLA